MSIQLTCPSGHTLKIADAWAGRAGRCPVCKAIVEVPALPPRPSPPPLPPLQVFASSTPAHLDAAPPASVVVAAPLPAETPTGDASSALKEPPPLPPHPINSFGNLSKRAVDSVVAEVGTLSTNAENGNSASRRGDRTTDFQVRPQRTTDFQVRPQSTDSKQVASAATVPVRASEETPKPPVAVAAPKIPAPPRTGYQPDADKRWTTYYLAAAIAALSLFCMAPAIPHWNLGSAPAWARAVLLLSLLQLAYGAWVASIPDWATLRASMIVLTVVAALYGLTMTMALTTPPEHALPLDLTDVKRQAVLWCAGVVLLASLVAYFCGRAAWRWRRTLELLRG
jgi:hypothetical protein